jgi:hypothetical protein
MVVLWNYYPKDMVIQRTKQFWFLAQCNGIMGFHKSMANHLNFQNAYMELSQKLKVKDLQ